MAKRIISFFIGLCISGICLFLAFKNVPFNDLIQSFSRINYLYISLSITLVMLSFVLRAIRWKILMSNKVDFYSCFHIMMTGFMLNCIMPARAGEIARPVLIDRTGRIDFSEAIASVAVERLFDVIVLLSLFILIYYQITIPETLSYNFGEYILNKSLLEDFVSGVTKLFMILFAGILIMAIDKTRELLLKFLNLFESKLYRVAQLSSFTQKYISLFCKITTNPLKSFINGFSSGISIIKSVYIFFKVIIVSSAIWLIQGISYFVVSKAFIGFELGIIEIFFVMLVICFFIAIPSVPGFWGVWEAGGIFAMMVFGISKADAASYNLINHVVQIFPVIITGLFSAWRIGLNRKK